MSFVIYRETSEIYIDRFIFDINNEKISAHTFLAIKNAFHLFFWIIIVSFVVTFSFFYYQYLN